MLLFSVYCRYVNFNYNYLILIYYFTLFYFLTYEFHHTDYLCSPSIIYLFIYIILLTEEDCGTVETFLCTFNYIFLLLIAMRLND